MTDRITDAQLDQLEKLALHRETICASCAGNFERLGQGLKDALTLLRTERERSAGLEAQVEEIRSWGDALCELYNFVVSTGRVESKDLVRWRDLVVYLHSEDFSTPHTALSAARAAVWEEAAVVAESWPCNCRRHYPPQPGKEQHHGGDCEAEIGRDIAHELRARASDEAEKTEEE